MGYSQQSQKQDSGNKVLRWIGRLIIVMVVLAITSFFTPGFSIMGLWSYLIAAAVISVLDFLVELLIGIDASPFGKGIKGFVISAIIIYVAQFFVPNMAVSIIGALLASLVIGILDAIFPARVM